METSVIFTQTLVTDVWYLIHFCQHDENNKFSLVNI